MMSYYQEFELLTNEPKSLIRYQSYRRIARSPRIHSVHYQSNFDRRLLAQSYISIVLAYIQGNNVAHGLKKRNTCKLPVLFSWAIQVASGLLRIHLFRFSELQNLLTVKKLVWSKTCLRPKQLVRDTRLGVQWLYKLYAFTYFVYNLLGLTR